MSLLITVGSFELIIAISFLWKVSVKFPRADNIIYKGTIVDNGCDNVLGSGQFYIVQMFQNMLNGIFFSVNP